MTVAIQFPQPLSRGRPTKFVPKPLSAPLFEGAASRHLEAGEALFVAGDRGDGCYRTRARPPQSHRHLAAGRRADLSHTWPRRDRWRARRHRQHGAAVDIGVRGQRLRTELH